MAERCVARARDLLSDLVASALWIEPSAGDGAFLDALGERFAALDVAPADARVVRADFLTWKPSFDGPTIVVGNPPFGRNCSLAVRFFNHAASFADAIAFVVPRTFEKESLRRRLDASFWQVGELELAQDVFELDGALRSVPCSFQIWRRMTRLRPLVRPALSHADFAFSTRAAADFSFQRVGVNAGVVSKDFSTKASASHYFIRDLTSDGRVAAILRGIDWAPIKSRTAGNPSIGKGELVSAYSAAAVGLLRKDIATWSGGSESSR